MVSYWLCVLILGGIIVVGGTLATRLFGDRWAAGPRVSPAGIGLGVMLALTASLLCLPARFPFARGSEMAYGALLGLGAALLAAIALWLSRPIGQHRSQVATFASLGGVALIWVATTGLLFSGSPRYALIGGAAAALLALLPAAWSYRDHEAKTAPLDFFGLAIVLLVLGVLLAIHRHDAGTLRPYWALPAVAMASGLLGAVVATLILGRTQAPRWLLSAITIVVAGGLWLGGLWLLNRTLDLPVTHHLTILLAMGWVGFALAALAIGAAGDRLAVRLIVPLLGMVLLIIGFNLGGAYGVSIALAGGLALSLPLGNWGQKRGSVSAVLWLAALGALYLAYRLFLEDFGQEFRGHVRLDFARHYVFVGLVAALVWAAAAWEQRPGRAAAVVQWGALALLPPVLFLVFGYEALLGLVLGLLIGQLLLPAVAARNAQPGPPLFFFPLIAVWALIVPNWAHFVLELPRWMRGATIAAVAVVAVLALGLPRERARPTPDPQAAGEN